MKLDKIDPNQKKKSRKGIIIGTSTVAVLAIASICGCTFLRSANNDVLKVAQHLVSGPVLQRALEEKKDNDEDESDGYLTPDVKPDLSKDQIVQLESYLSRLGYGYSNKNSLIDGVPSNMNTLFEFPGDKDNKTGKAEQLYMLWNGKTIEDRPKYEENPLFKVEPVVTINYVELIEGDIGPYCYRAQASFVDFPSGNEIFSGEVIGYSKEDATEKAKEVIQEKYEEAHERYEEAKKDYEKWSEWRSERNQWLMDNYDKGFFTSKEPGDEWTDYTRFWTKVALKSIGGVLENADGITSESVNELLTWLHAQLYDSDDVELPERDLLREMLDWIADGDQDNIPQINSPVDGSQVPVDMDSSAGESGGGGSGGSGGGGSGGSGGSGGETGGGSGGETGGGSGGEGGSGGDGGEEKPDETTPLEVKSLAITSPLKSSIYKAGQEIKLKVTFSKDVYATAKKVAITKATAPSLYISFVDEANGQNNSNVASKQATFESVSGRNLVYTYKVADGDNGRLVLGQGDNFKGTVYDESGKMLLLTKIEEMSETPIVVADTISPSVQSIEAISEERSYQTGEEIEIKVTFSEKVYGNDSGVPLLTKTVPKLNISFGDGKVKNPEIKTINESEHYLIYRYIIQSDDRGTLKVNPSEAFDGSQNIYDSVGNGTVLVAGPALTGSSISANADLAVVTLNKTELTLDLNGTKEETLVATTKPEGLEITWSVADDKVATVDSKTGKVTAVAIGETTVTATAPDGTTATCKVVVKDTTKGETKLTLNKTQLELDLSGTKEEQLKATVEPTDMEVTWTSSNIKVATVDSKTGKVTAVGVGNATITARTQDGTTATCKVTVKDSAPTEIEPTGIEFLTVNPSVILGRTEELQMQTRLTPSNCNTNTGITYESSNEEVATIDPNGKVTIKAVGTTVITATTENGKSVSTNLTVIEKTSENTTALGDVTGDTKIDSSDLLSMLRHVAASASSDIKSKHQDWLIQGDSYVIADIDGNGRIDITDVLKLQRHIAFTKSEVVQKNHPDWEIKSDWVTVNAIEPVQEELPEDLQAPEEQEENPVENQEGTENEITAEIYDVKYSQELEQNSKVVLSSKEDMDTYLQAILEDDKMTTVINNKYDEEYFKEKSLALVYVVMPSGGMTVEYEGSVIQDNTITVQYKVNELEEGMVGTAEMTAACIVLEVDKDITEIE